MLTCPRVSVIIPAYNASRTIERALDSVAAQKYPEVEVVVIDDCSVDVTAQVVEGYKKRAVTLVRLPKNLGVCGATNVGLAKATGDYVTFLDADDELLPEKLAKQVVALERNQSASFSTCAYTLIGPSGEPAGEHGYPPPDLNKGEAWRHLLVRNFIAKACVMARAGAIAKAGPFDLNLAVAEDQDMWIRLARLGELEFVAGVLVNVHDTPNSLGKRYAAREAEYVLPMVNKHIAQLLPRLSKADLRDILRERYSSVGRDLCHAGEYLQGTSYILRSIGKGASLRRSMWFLFLSSPAVKALRRRWRHLTGRKLAQADRAE